MSFYKPLVYKLYPDYVPPVKFEIPLKNKFSLVTQFVLQQQKKLYIYKLLVREIDKQMYHKLFTYHRRLSKFVTRVKYRCAKCANSKNLYGDPLKKHHVSVLEKNQIYKFDYFEMFKLIKEKIHYHENFFLMPKFPANPYTNVPFKIHNLYNIYLQLLTSSYVLPINVKIFLNVNFDLNKLVERYSYNMLVEVITRRFYELRLSEKYNIMRDMLLYFKKRVFLNRPNEQLYTIFCKQVLEYYKATYLPTWCSNMMMYQLKRYFTTYHKKHPSMGKMTISMFTNEVIIC